ncbi:sensor histidine kinase [Haliangium sp.]
MALSDGGLSISQTTWVPLFVVMGLYLLGIRGGAALMGGFFAVIVVDYAALKLDWYLFGQAVLESDPDGAMVPNASALALFALLFYVYETAQRRTMVELSEALLASDSNRRQLASVFESTDAAICSLDHELRLIGFNQAFVELVGGDAATMMVGERLSEYDADPRVGRWLTEAEAVLAGGGSRRVEDRDEGEARRRRETVLHPIALEGAGVIGVTLFSEDIEGRKQAAEERRRLHQELAQASREVGMTSVASETLHVMGNVLNSVGVAATMMQKQVGALRSTELDRAVALMEAHADDLPVFLQQDARGRRVPELLRAFGSHLAEQERRLRAEGAALKEGVDQLTRMLRAQRAYTRQTREVQACAVPELFELAMSLQAPTWAGEGITVERCLEPQGSLPRLWTDRNRVIEILLNLISNARDALRASDRADKRLVLRAARAGDDRVRIAVEDNGIGIAPEVLPKLFELGFTTKPEGNGLGLHAGANAARLLGGSLRCESEGLGRGARFILELPTEARGDGREPGDELAANAGSY